MTLSRLDGITMITRRAEVVRALAVISATALGVGGSVQFGQWVMDKNVHASPAEATNTPGVNVPTSTPTFAIPSATTSPTSESGTATPNVTPNPNIGPAGGSCVGESFKWLDPAPIEARYPFPSSNPTIIYRYHLQEAINEIEANSWSGKIKIRRHQSGGMYISDPVRISKDITIIGKSPSDVQIRAIPGLSPTPKAVINAWPEWNGCNIRLGQFEIAGIWINGNHSAHYGILTSCDGCSIYCNKVERTRSSGIFLAQVPCSQPDHEYTSGEITQSASVIANSVTDTTHEDALSDAIDLIGDGSYIGENIVVNSAGGGILTWGGINNTIEANYLAAVSVGIGLDNCLRPDGIHGAIPCFTRGGGNFIEHNTIVSTRSIGESCCPVAGISLSMENRANVGQTELTYNYIASSQEEGVIAQGSEDILIEHNNIYKTNHAGILIQDQIVVTWDTPTPGPTRSTTETPTPTPTPILPTSTPVPTLTAFGSGSVDTATSIVDMCINPSDSAIKYDGVSSGSINYNTVYHSSAPTPTQTQTPPVILFGGGISATGNTYNGCP